MRFLVLRVAAVALAILALPGWAHAQWLTSSAGQVTTSNSSNTADSQGVVSYGVYQANAGQTVGQALAAAFGNSNANFSNFSAATLNTELTSTAYIYAYTLTNSVPNAGSLTALSISSPSANVLAGGYVGGTVLNSTETGGANGGNVDFSYVGGGPLGVAFDAPALTPLMQGQTTTVMALISYIAPTTGTVETFDQVAPDSFGSLAVPGPEPATFGLLALGLPVFGFGYARRLRQKLAARSAVVA